MPQTKVGKPEPVRDLDRTEVVVDSLRRLFNALSAGDNAQEMRHSSEELANTIRAVTMQQAHWLGHRLCGEFDSAKALELAADDA